jgi:hypothetical protein
MSLLTNDQIMELTKLAINKSAHLTLFDTFYDLNKNQTGNQVNVNWGDAPKFAGKAVLRLHWVTGSKGSELWTASEDAITLERPAPAITPHPHAEIMAKYAEVAARCAHPWIEFDVKFEYGDWGRLNGHPTWGESTMYRHIGETK